MTIKYARDDGLAWLKCEDITNGNKKKKCHKKAAQKSKSNKKKVAKSIKKEWKTWLKEMKALVKANPSIEGTINNAIEGNEDLKEGFEESATTGNETWPYYGALNEEMARDLAR